MKVGIYFVLAVVVPAALSAQIGTKTHRRYPPSSNLVVNETGPLYVNGGAAPPAPIVFDKTMQFLNETRSKMASGICFKEVATSSLIPNNKHEVPSGNGSDPSVSKIQVCCEGYERNAHNFYKCEPICKDGCPHGICVAPDTCVCYPDAVRNLANFCVPTCPIGCGNGECQLDGSCRCKEGFVLDASKKFCSPFCSKGCANGNCTEPEVCTCNTGFILGLEGCEPKCDSCEFGKCTSPGVCECNKGYIRKENRCEPVCSLGCNKGTCIAPETCSCKPGYELDKTGTNCVPHCDQPCLNGFCDGHNVCTCFNGYISDEKTPNICKPHCPQGCPNGYCTSPNFCVCRPGFVKSGVKGRQQCMPV